MYSHGTRQVAAHANGNQSRSQGGDNDEAATPDQDKKLRMLLDRYRKLYVKLNLEKLQLRLKDVPYIGHLLTSEGLKVDPGKVTAIKQMPKAYRWAGGAALPGLGKLPSQVLQATAMELCEPL